MRLPRAACALVVVLCCAAGCERSRSPAQIPHVLLVTIDTLRPDHLSAYGYERTTSPNLDRLAAEGALFKVAYAPAPTTMPSHATLLTSRYPVAHGVVRNGIPLGDELPTLPAMLAERGYRTAAFVSSFAVSREFGFARGFEHFDDRFEGTSTLRRRRWNDREVVGAFDRLGERTVDAAITWWTSLRDDAPRFVWVHLFDPHAPYSAPPPFGRTFRHERRSKVERRIDAYDGEILYADAQVGRLVGALSASAGPRGVLTVITADHGEAFGEHGWHGHNRTVFEEEIRVPLIVHWPGVVGPGRRVPAVTHLADVVPTVAVAAGLDVRSRGWAGIDLLPLIAGEGGGDVHRAVYLQRPYFGDRKRAGRHGSVGFGFGVRRGNWKYLEALEEQQRRLFDLVADPGERHDLAEQHAAHAAEMSELIASWREREMASAAVAASALNSEDARRKLRALGYVD